MLPSTSDKDELSKLAQGIIDSLSRPYTINGTAVSIGASVGIVTSDYDDRTSDDLMRDADLALYAAKAAGKGCFRFFAPEMHEAARERQLMESDLRVALEKEQLRVVFQPVRRCFERGGDRLRGADPLGPSRARPDQPGAVHPARRGNRPHQRDRRVGAAHRLRRSGQMAGRTSRSRSTCRRSSSSRHALPTTVRAVLSDTELPANRLELEITEGVFLSNDDHVHDMIGSLKTIGLKLALDDFGTGYSSLSYLQRVPFDKIKIDRSSSAARPIRKAATPR